MLSYAYVHTLKSSIILPEGYSVPEGLPEKLSDYGEGYDKAEELLSPLAEKLETYPWRLISDFYDCHDVWAVDEDGYDTENVFVADHTLSDDEQLQQCIDYSNKHGYNVYQMSDAQDQSEEFWLKVAKMDGKEVRNVASLGIVDSYSYEVYSYEPEPEEIYEDSY